MVKAEYKRYAVARPHMEIMMILNIAIWTALVAVPFMYLYRIILRRRQFCNKINKLPGPTAYFLIGTALQLYGVSRKELFKFMDKITRENGPIFRTWVGPIPDVHLTLPRHMEVIMSSTTNTDKADSYSFLHCWLGRGLLTSKGARWHSHRKMITPTFHFNILETFLEIFDEKSQILIEKLQKCEYGSTVDICPFITKCTLDIICETAMGTPINAQEGADSPYLSSLYVVCELLLHRLLKPWLHMDFIYKRTRVGKLFYESLKVLHSFTTKVIQERKERKDRKENNDNITHMKEDSLYFGVKRRSAFLDLLLDVSENGRKLSVEDIREEVDTFMFEGHDTTTTGISWALFLLGHHKNIQNEVYEELNEIFQGCDRPATMRDLHEMKYLERVIKESLRLYPSVPFIGRKLSEEIEIDGYKIPAGCNVNLHIYHVHHDPNTWGPNPEIFNPENFSTENSLKRHPFAYVPFSGGPRNCIGQKFAMLEEKVIIGNILRRFEIESLQSMDDIKITGELVLRPADGILLRLKPRLNYVT